MVYQCKTASDTMRTVSPGAGAEVRRFTEDIMHHVHLLPPVEQIGPRPTSKGSVDLTGGKLFLQSQTLHATLIDIIERRAPSLTVGWEGGRQLKFSAVMRFLLRSLHSLYTLWSQKETLTTDQMLLYDKSVDTLHKSWLALGWKPTVWVHWVCAHSSFYVHSFRSIYSFTSIPTEHRHQKFKMDLRHAFEGWKFANPLVTSRWLTRVVNLDALDQGLHLLSLTNEVGTDAIFKRHNKKRKLE